VFIPKGSRLLEVKGIMQGDKNDSLGEVMVGFENERQWFGGFVSIEPEIKEM
jgi:hypothetical protein